MAHCLAAFAQSIVTHPTVSRLLRGALGSVLAALFVGLVGCQVPELALPQTFLAHSTVYPVKGRYGFLLKQQLSFGPYRSGIIDRDWQSSQQWKVGGYEMSSAEGGYRFVLSGGATPNRIACFQQASLEALDFDHRPDEDFSWIIDSQQRFSCAISTADGQEYLLLISDFNNEAKAEGILYSSDGNSYLVSSSREAAGHQWPIDGMGYIIRQGRQVVAAVENINAGRVWLLQELPEDHALLLASTAAALLLYQELEL